MTRDKNNITIKLQTQTLNAGIGVGSETISY